MSVAGDGDNAGVSGAEPPVAGPLPPAAGPNPRHRVPPTAAAAARVLPEPFTPPKPKIPAVPHQRRPDGPTAVASAAVPPAEEPDPLPVATLAGEARADAADMGDTRNLEFIVSLPGISNDPDELAPSSADPIETVDGELVPDGPAFAADDSPTVADYKVPALTIVTDYAHEDAEDYRGSRRHRVMPWRRYPVGAVAVAVLILLVTGAVAFQAVRGDSTPGKSDSVLPGRVPGVDMPGGAAPAGAVAGPSDETTGPEATDDGANPATTRPRTTATGSAASHPTGSAAVSTPPTKAATPPPPPPVAQPTQGRVVGAQSRKCLEYRSGSAYRVVIDDCGGPAQVFRVQGNAATGAVLLADNNYCLDVQNRDTANGTLIQVYQCNGTPAQVWVHRADNTWQNPNAKRCLTATGTGAGSSIVIWDCVGAASQIWTMQ
jgi:hypothetical protein